MFKAISEIQRISEEISASQRKIKANLKFYNKYYGDSKTGEWFYLHPWGSIFNHLIKFG